MGGTPSRPALTLRGLQPSRSGANVLKPLSSWLIFFWFKQVLDQGPEQRESKMTVLCLLIIIILISYIIVYYIINYGEPSQPKPETDLPFFVVDSPDTSAILIGVIYVTIKVF